MRPRNVSLLRLPAILMCAAMLMPSLLIPRAANADTLEDTCRAKYGTNLAIVAASYGAKDRVINVTARLQKKIADNRLQWRVGNDWGDPAPFTPKEVKVVYWDGQSVQREQIGEGGTLKLEAAAEKPQPKPQAVPTAPPAATSAPQPDEQNVVDLLKLVDPTKDAVVGKWTLKDGALSTGVSPRGRLQIPYHPPAEYDVHVQFTRESGREIVAVFLVGGGNQFFWLMGGWHNTVDGFEAIGDQSGDTNGSAVHLTNALVNGQRYDLILKVRKTGVAAFLDGKLLSSWKTDYSNMRMNAAWPLKDALALGVGADVSATRFFKIEVKEISGKGEIVEHDVPPATPIVRRPPAPPPVARIPERPAPEKVSIDISITCAKPDPKDPPPAQPASADPNAIERPDYQNRPKALVKTLTSATAMMVQSGADGDMMGLTSDIIATVDPDSRRSDKAGIGILRTDGDETMKTALEEAVRAVKLRYPLWQPGHIDISFGEKFVAHGGPSAGTAFALLMLSTLEGFDLDPKCAVTGDITVDWKVRKVGGVTAKLHGATLDGCLYAAIPEGNETAFADMALLYGNSALCNIQVFSIATLQDANAIARKDRPAKLAEAIKLFADLQSQLTAGKATLLSIQSQKTLEHVLELAPNHLSAKYLLPISQGAAPRTLSANATLYRLDVIMYPYFTLLHGDEKIGRTTLSALTTANARKQLAALRPIANKEILPLLTDESAFIESMDAFAQSPSNFSRETLLARAGTLDARFDELASDKELRGRLRREGY